jgi:hypothetical protein
LKIKNSDSEIRNQLFGLLYKKNKEKMSNIALQSLVRLQIVETEKFASNLLPPNQTIVLVNNEINVENNRQGFPEGRRETVGNVLSSVNTNQSSAVFSLSASTSSLSDTILRYPNQSQTIEKDVKRGGNINSKEDKDNEEEEEEEEDEEEEEEEIVPESLREELKRLENTIREEHETNERIMAQNIALLADLEAAQRMVRELRAGKNALALQLRQVLQQQQQQQQQQTTETR